MKQLILPYLTVIQKHYDSLSKREKNAVVLLAMVLGLSFLWSGIWKPLQHMHDVGIANYHTAYKDLAWMQLHANEVKPVLGLNNASGNTVSPLNAVTDTAALFQITISNAEPAEDGTLRVTLDNVAFSHFLPWLEQMQREYSVKVTSAVVQRVDSVPGVINATLVLRYDAQ